MLLSTWSFGRVANAAGWPVLAAGGEALDAAVAGATAVEEDPAVDSVGIGGLPDASGQVSLDACVMTDPDRCGAVCYVRRFPHAAGIARRVMERTIYIMLAGEGAERFAESEGFAPRQLLTDEARRQWEAWRQTAGARGQEDGRLGYTPPMNVEERYHRAREPMHDTVCVLARDATGGLAGVCTTSGLGFKLPGRVGDSPIIGHGLYVEQSVGAATATGNGELIMGVCGSFLAVELMRQGRPPEDALMGVLERAAAVSTRRGAKADHQAALVAIRADGAWAAASLRPGFSYCLTTATGTELRPAPRVLFPG